MPRRHQLFDKVRLIIFWYILVFWVGRKRILHPSPGVKGNGWMDGDGKNFQIIWIMTARSSVWNFKHQLWFEKTYFLWDSKLQSFWFVRVVKRLAIGERCLYSFSFLFTKYSGEWKVRINKGAKMVGASSSDIVNTKCLDTLYITPPETGDTDSWAIYSGQGCSYYTVCTFFFAPSDCRGVAGRHWWHLERPTLPK